MNEPNVTPLRVLIASLGVPHASDGASVVLYYHYIDRILRDGHTVHHILFLEASDWSDQAVDAYRTNIETKGAIEISIVRAQKFTRMTLGSVRLDAAAVQAATQQASRFKPDVTVAFDIVPAALLQHVEARRHIVWLGDLIYDVMRWHAHYALRETPSGIFNLPRDWLAARNWRTLYTRVLRRFTDIIVSSGSSVGELSRFGITAQYEPYPWPSEGVVQTATPPAKPTFVFFGTLAGLGSRSGMAFFTGQVYPRLLSLWGSKGFRILIAGRGKLSEEFQAMMAGKDEFEWLGFVPNLDTLLTSSHAVIAPIEVPVGNRSRILTALAKGALVIAHTNVAQGNPALIDGQTCALAATPAEFVRHMRRAVEDTAWAHEIAEHGRQCYATLFAPERAAIRLSQRIVV